MRILLVEDDPSLGATIQSWLLMDHYAVDWVKRGDHADTALLNHDYQCVLLDRGLPGLGGDDLLARLRARNHAIPVVVITARDTLHDRIKGLDLGADDYLIKPFDLEELSARVRAALRRGAHQPTVALRHGPVELDPVSKKVLFDGRPIALTAREFAVLRTLMANHPHPLSRAQLEESLYSWGEEVESNAVEVHIHHLRKKLGSGLIVTVRHHGYALSSPP